MSKYIEKAKIDNIPIQFRQLCNMYIDKLLGYKEYKISYINTEIIKSLEIFLGFISNEYPDWADLKKLNRLHMQCFLHYFNNEYGHLEQKDRVYLQNIRRFLQHISIFGFKESPIINSSILLSEQDIPKKYNKKKVISTIKSC